MAMSAKAASVRDFMGGRMFAIHFRSAEALRRHPASARLDVLGGEPRPPRLHGDRQRPRPVQLPHPAQARPVGRADHRRQAKAMFEEALAAPLDIEIIARSAWNAGYTLVAEKFQRGRIFLGGDAVHLFTPAGGLGYNTAVEDAVNLGWKLERRAQGLGRPCAARHLRDRAAGDCQAQHRPTPAALPTRSGCSCRRRSWRTRVRRARRRASSPATTSTTTPASSSTFRASPSAAATTARRSWCPDGTAPPPDAAEQLPAHRLPGRPRAASLARRRPVALRHARLRVHAACARRKACRPGAVPRRRRGAEHAAVGRAGRRATRRAISTAPIWR